MRYRRDSLPCTRRGVSVFAAAVVLSAAGCTVGPKYHPPVAQAPSVYKEVPAQFKPGNAPPDTAEALKEWQPAKPSDAMLRGKWWEIYNEPELNALEDKLEIDNQTIKQAFENYMAARALVREARAQYYPTLGTTPAWSRSRTSANLGSTSSAGQSIGRQTNLASLPFEASWEPDLWGRIRNTVHEQQYSAQLSAADLENQRLAEQSSLAELFFEIRGQDALQKVLDETVDADRKALALTQGRYDTGVDTQLSVAEATTTLRSAESAATNVGLLRAQYEHAIATLLGTPASNFSIPVRPITTAPPPIPLGLPSQLLERRPDVAAAERTVAADNARIGIAYAAYYPTVTLSASAGLESSTFKHLLDWPSRFWSVGPSISETIYDGGLRRATVNQYIATYNADLASYRESVLNAFQQVEDYLSNVRILSRQIQQQQEAVASAQTSLDLELGRYQTGIDPYLNVVTLQTTLLSDQQTLTNLQIQQMTASVQLIQALGGGWDVSQLPSPAQVAVKPTKAETTIQQ